MTSAFPDDELAELADLVIRAARKLQALPFPERGVIELTHFEALVMSRIDGSPRISPKQISAALRVKSSNLSAALRELEKKGLIVRHPDPNDGRGVVLSATPLARENLARVRASWSAALAPLVGDPSAFRATLATLRGIDAGLE